MSTVSALNAALKDPIVTNPNTGRLEFSTLFVRFLNNFVTNGRVNTGSAQPVTIASGVISLITGFSNYTITVETGASDDVDTIKNLVDGDLVFFRAASASATVVFKDGTGNIITDGSVDLSLDNSQDIIIGHYDGTNLKCAIWNIGA